MPDLNDQLHGYHDALAATVAPVSVGEAMTTAAPPSPEARHRRARWQWRIVAAATAVLVVVVGSVAVLGARGPMRWFTDDGGDVLRDRTFVAVSMHDVGDEPEPATGSLTFNGDSIDVYDGCNSGSGPYTIEQGRLVADAVVMTGAACGHPDSQSGRWTRVLASAAFEVDGDHLTLSDDTITVELVDEVSPRPPETVVGTVPAPVGADDRPPTLAELEGRSFRSTSVLEAGEEKVLAPSIDAPDVGAPSRLWFQVRGGILSASGGCNGLSFSPTITDGRLDVIRGTQSLRDCGEPLEAQDTWFFDFLDSSPEIAVAGSTLTLSSGTTVIVLAEEPSTELATTTLPTTSTPMATPPTTVATTTSLVESPDVPVSSPLVGTTWELVRIDRGPKVTDPVDPRITTPIDVTTSGRSLPTLRFTTAATAQSGGTIAGNNGCYQLVGGYSSPTGSSLSFSAVSMPLDNCDPQAKAIAIAFDAALGDQQHPFASSIDDSGLRLESETWTLQFRPA